MTQPKITINAIHSRDAEKFWRKLGLKKTEPCFVCGADVTAKDFAALGKNGGRIVVCCEKGHCFFEFNYKVKEK